MNKILTSALNNEASSRRILRRTPLAQSGTSSWMEEGHLRNSNLQQTLANI